MTFTILGLRTILFAHLIVQGDIRRGHAAVDARIELGSGEDDRHLRRLEPGQI